MVHTAQLQGGQIEILKRKTEKKFLKNYFRLRVGGNLTANRDERRSPAPRGTFWNFENKGKEMFCSGDWFTMCYIAVEGGRAFCNPAFQNWGYRTQNNFAYRN